MTALSLSGYVTIVDETHIKLNGDNKQSFSHLGSDYWAPGVCRHVSKDKQECTVKTMATTLYEKNGAECKRDDLAGCYAVANVRIKKYSFRESAGAKPITGWQIVTKTIKQCSPVHP